MSYALSLQLSVLLCALVLVWIIAQHLLQRKIKRWMPSQYLMILGLLVSLTIFHWPFSYEEIGGIANIADLMAVLGGSLHNTLRLFLVDGDFFEMMADVGVSAKELTSYYRAVGAVFYVLPPLLTFGALLSFVKNLFASVRYFLTVCTVHVFSELNEKSLALAQSLVEDSKRRHPILSHFIPCAAIVFTDVVEKQEELHYDLVAESEKIRAVLFQKDLESVRFRFRLGALNPRARLVFYLISDDESEKLRHADWVMREYDRRRTRLYIFSCSVQSEMFLSTKKVAAKKRDKKRKGALDLTHLKVIRINDVQALIYHNLDRYGARLFDKARKENEGHIHALVVGVGGYGQEMIKALSWFCQVPDFTLRITAFEENEAVLARFRSRCPDMIAKGINEAEERQKNGDNDAHYTIDLRGGVEVGSDSFYQQLKNCENVTNVFVSLGSDEKNIAAAVAIRSYFAAHPTKGPVPDIETVVYDSDAAQAMGMTWHENIDIEKDDATVDGIRNRKHPYRIHMIGDLASFYSVDTVINSSLMEAGLLVHLRYSTGDNSEIRALDAYGSMQADKEEARRLAEAVRSCDGTRVIRRKAKREKPLPFKERIADYRARKSVQKTVRELERLHGHSFWMLEYNYRSSIAKALHERLRKKLAENGYLKLPSACKEWGRRTEEEKLAIGRYEHIRWNAYMRSEGYSYAEQRNDLAKLHNLIRPTNELKDDDLRKDA